MLKYNSDKSFIFLYLITFCFFFLDFTNLQLSSTISIKYYHLFTPFIFFYLAFNYEKLNRFKFFEIILILLYFYLGLTFFWSIDQILSLKLMFLQLILIIVYFYFRFEFSQFSIQELESFIIKVGKYYILGSLFFYLLGVYEFKTNPIVDELFYSGLMQERILPRLRGFAESPNSYVPYGLFFFIFFINQNKFFWMFISCISIILSFSSTGIIIMGIIIIINYLNKIRFKIIFFLTMIILFIIVLYIFFIQNNENIMQMIEWRLERNISGTGRIDLWMYSLELINNNVFGYGINTTRVLIENFHALNSVHNTILESFLTGGFIALFLYILLCLCILFYSILIWKYHHDNKMFLLFIVFVMTGITNNTLHIGYSIFSLSIMYQYIIYKGNTLNAN